jgi:hypothetical protein
MSAQTTSPTETLPSKAAPLVAYLRERVREEGTLYVKSRFIAEDIGLSSKEIGSYMQRIQDAATDLDVEAWAYTNGTTWRVSPE